MTRLEKQAAKLGLHLKVTCNRKGAPVMWQLFDEETGVPVFQTTDAVSLTTYLMD